MGASDEYIYLLNRYDNDSLISSVFCSDRECYRQCSRRINDEECETDFWHDSCQQLLEVMNHITFRPHGSACLGVEDLAAMNTIIKNENEQLKRRVDALEKLAFENRLDISRTVFE